MTRCVTVLLMANPTRWPGSSSDEHSRWYIQRFRTMAASGADLAGEARLVDAMVPRAARILDAGCGSGRLGGELSARGHRVVGVDVDPLLIEAAAEDFPGPTWITADLAELDLTAVGEPEPFDAIVVAGNVMTFLGEGTEPAVLANLRRHLVSGGFIVVGFGTNRGYSLPQFDADVAAAGLHLEHRFSTWDLQPWSASSDFAVSVLRAGPR